MGRPRFPGVFDPPRNEGGDLAGNAVLFWGVAPSFLGVPDVPGEVELTFILLVGPGDLDGGIME